MSVVQDLIDEMLTKYEADLAATGFRRKERYEEPELLDTYEGVKMSQLKIEYDKWLKYYNYLASELALRRGLVEAMKREAKTVRSSVYLRACAVKKLTNEAARVAWTDCDRDNLEVQLSMDRTNALSRALEELRKAASKTMDRIGRELYTQTGRQYHQDSGNNKSGRPWQGHKGVVDHTRPQQQQPQQQQKPRQRPTPTRNRAPDAGLEPYTKPRVEVPEGGTPTRQKAPRGRRPRHVPRGRRPVKKDPE